MAMLATHASVALIIVSVVLSFGSVTGAELRLPAELHENLDLISVMEVEGATSSAVRDATEGENPSLCPSLIVSLQGQ